MAYTFEGQNIETLRDIRGVMKDVVSMGRGRKRSDRAKAFAEGYREVDPNADANMGRAAGYLGDQYTLALQLFKVEHPVFGTEDPRDAGERLVAEDEAVEDEAAG